MYIARRRPSRAMEPRTTHGNKRLSSPISSQAVPKTKLIIHLAPHCVRANASKTQRERGCGNVA